jgi:hypothetical protein
VAAAEVGGRRCRERRRPEGVGEADAALHGRGRGKWRVAGCWFKSPDGRATIFEARNRAESGGSGRGLKKQS